MTRKEQIIEVLKKHIGECAISGDDADYLLFHLTKDILSLPIDVPSDEEINMESQMYLPRSYKSELSEAIIIAFRGGHNVGAKWAINEILKRNGNGNNRKI